MDISLNTTEVTEAVVQYLTNRGFKTKGQEIDVRFSSTRGTPGGINASVSLEEKAQPTETTQTVGPGSEEREAIF